MSFYKFFSQNDRVVTTNPLYEIISLEKGTDWLSSSYDPYNFVQYALSSSTSTTFQEAEHVFDLTFASTTGSVDSKKYIYNQFGKMLLGHNSDNTIKKFTLLEDVENTGLPETLPFAFIINLSRAEVKDKIKQGTFDLTVSVNDTNDIRLIDSGSYLHEGAGGHHYGILQATSSDGILEEYQSTGSVGYVFYEAGIAVVSPYVFVKHGLSTNIVDQFTGSLCGILDSAADDEYGVSLNGIIKNGTIKELSEFFAPKLKEVQYIATTELNSTIYFCRAFNHEFNYSSNPTYIKDSEIVVKNGDPEEPSRTYITTVGLYDDNNQLLAVAKLSEPILKTKDNELIARVRLDF